MCVRVYTCTYIKLYVFLWAKATVSPKWEGLSLCHSCTVSVSDACRSCYDCKVLFQSLASHGRTTPTVTASPSPKQRKYRFEIRTITDRATSGSFTLEDVSCARKKREKRKRKEKKPPPCPYDGLTCFSPLPRREKWGKTFPLLF